MLSTNAPTPLGCQPHVKTCSSSWRILLVYNSGMYIYVSPVVRSSIFEPLLNPWRRFACRLMMKPDKRRTSWNTSNRSCVLIGGCEGGQQRISSWLLVHSQTRQTGCKQFLSWFLGTVAE